MKKQKTTQTKLIGNNGFLSFPGLFLTLAIICFLGYLLLQNYFLKKPISDENTANSLHEQGINSGSYQSILDTTRKRIKDIHRENVPE